MPTARFIGRGHRHVQELGEPRNALVVIDLETGTARGADEGCVRTVPVRLDAGRIMIGLRAAIRAALDDPGPPPAPPPSTVPTILRDFLRACADGPAPAAQSRPASSS